MEAELKNRLFPFHQDKGTESLPKDGRLIAIGDVHGCVRELEKLLKKVAPAKEDHILFLGDLINRGPDSKAVLQLARDLNARSLLGNHEYRLLQYYHDPKTSDLKPYELETLKNLDNGDWRYLSSMVLWLQAFNGKRLFVHGGFLPSIPWYRQSAEIVTQIQAVNGQGQPCRTNGGGETKPWTHYWKKGPFVVYGHTPRPDVYRTPNSLGIDTGCVWGGKLTACIFPGTKIVQIKSAKNYVKDNK